MEELWKNWGFWTFVVSVIVMFVGDGGLIKALVSLWKKIHKKDKMKSESGEKSNSGVKRFFIVLAFLILIALNAVLGYILYVRFFPHNEIGYIYVLNDNDTVTITGVKDKELTDLIIPDEIKKNPVTEIADNAFADCKAIDITIPAHVETIGSNAFTGCKNLLNIHVDEGNEIFESDHGILFNELKTKVLCYSEGKKLGEVVVSGECGPEAEWRLYESGVLWISGKGKTTGYEKAADQPWAEYRNNITSVVMEGYITDVGSRMFMDCSNMKYIIIPESVTEIGWWTFGSCNGMEEMVIPDSVYKINCGAFEHCEYLKTVVIGKSLRDLNRAFFCGDRRTQSIIVSSENESFTSLNGALYNKEMTELIHVPKGVTGKFIVPETVTILGKWSCQFSSYDEIVLPSSIVEIRECALSWVNNMKSITIPKSVKMIGNKAFRGTTNLTEIYYEGTKEDWKKIQIDKTGMNEAVNAALLNATIHYLGEQG